MSFEFISGGTVKPLKRAPHYFRLPETIEEERLLKQSPRLYEEYCKGLENQKNEKCTK